MKTSEVERNISIYPVLFGSKNRYGQLDGASFKQFYSWIAVILNCPTLGVHSRIRDMIAGFKGFGSRAFGITPGFSMVTYPGDVSICYSTIRTMAQFYGMIANEIENPESRSEAEDSIRKLGIEYGADIRSGINGKLLDKIGGFPRHVPDDMDEVLNYIVKMLNVESIEIENELISELNFEFDRIDIADNTVSQRCQYVKRINSALVNVGRDNDMAISALKKSLNELNSSGSTVMTRNQRFTIKLINSLKDLFGHLLAFIHFAGENKREEQEGSEQFKLQFKLRVRKSAARIIESLKRIVKPRLERLERMRQEFKQHLEDVSSNWKNFQFDEKARVPSGICLLKREDFSKFFERRVSPHLDNWKNELRLKLSSICRDDDPIEKLREFCERKVRSVLPASLSEYIETEMTRDEAVSQFIEAIRESWPRVVLRKGTSAYPVHRIVAVPESDRGIGRISSITVEARDRFCRGLAWTDDASLEGPFSPSPWDALFIQVMVVDIEDINMEYVRDIYKSSDDTSYGWTDYPYQASMPVFPVDESQGRVLLAKAILCGMVQSLPLWGGECLILDSGKNDVIPIRTSPVKAICNNHRAAFAIWNRFAELLKSTPGDKIIELIEDTAINEDRVAGVAAKLTTEVILVQRHKNYSQSSPDLLCKPGASVFPES